MQFVSLKFLAFLFATIFIYFIFPKKIRYIWLLATSMAFYYLVGGKFIGLLLAESVLAYVVGLVVAEKEGRSIYLRDVVLACGVAMSEQFSESLYLFLNVWTISQIQRCLFCSAITNAHTRQISTPI